ncbi:LexA family protein [Thiosulfativibrio zosterae]|uniref:SOS (Error prone) mutagenesis protein UmuD (RumA) n=1 Tax=Thiosulfativibrio zosterae TaxID=2675053 RepID=A0A6F8PMS2_9GAMM|nr:translesion error-prone DNA polymerase V autoproteolytic subunit [Thiosulfativibrio zosterae]BBP43411.1 SOS (error prone) mutagenesis protein UmuD (RumA) [Thiosulfativibrio zosterae]
MTEKTHGGKRSGAGRKKGSGLFGEDTKVIRIPESKVTLVKNWLRETAEIDKQRQIKNELQALAKNKAQVYLATDEQDPEANRLNLYSHKVVAGFPSPADDYIEDRLNLNDQLIPHKESTFLLRVQGDSMKKIGIFDGDLLVVDKSLKPSDGKIVIAALDGELTVKRLSIKSTGTWLVPENDNYPPIPVREESEVVIWGVVTATIHQFK